MNISGTGGLALVVAAALWLAVFIPSWMKRNEERQNVLKNTKPSRGETTAKISYRKSLEEIAASLDKAVAVDPRAWERQPVPAQIVRVGELELPPSAPVIEISQAAKIETAPELTGAELDEIMRRRRAVG
jgi:hypothetical protein